MTSCGFSVALIVAWLLPPSVVTGDVMAVIEVEAPGTPVRAGAHASATKLGLLARGTRLRVWRRVEAKTGAHHKCEAWFELCPSDVPGSKKQRGFVCQKYVRLSEDKPHAQRFPKVKSQRLLPKSYAFIRFDGTPVFATLAKAARGDFIGTLGKGYGIVVTDVRMHQGISYAKTRKGRWIEREALGAVRGSDYEGVAFDLAAVAMAWTRRDGVKAGNKSGYVRQANTLFYRTEMDSKKRDKPRWLSIFGYPTCNLRHAKPLYRPGIAQDDHWIDVSLKNQTLGSIRGRNARVRYLGVYRQTENTRHLKARLDLWIKLAYSDMDDLELDTVASNYLIEDVPWVQYFSDGIGFHAAFWHDNFGNEKEPRLYQPFSQRCSSSIRMDRAARASRIYRRFSESGESGYARSCARMNPLPRSMLPALLWRRRCRDFELRKHKIPVRL